MGVEMDSYHPYPRAKKPLRRFTLLWWKRFVSSGMIVQAMHVEVEEPFGSGLERFWSPVFRSLFARSMRCLWI
jgi:hypothetical protein